MDFQEVWGAFLLAMIPVVEARLPATAYSLRKRLPSNLESSCFPFAPLKPPPKCPVVILLIELLLWNTEENSEEQAQEIGAEL